MWWLTFALCAREIERMEERKIGETSLAVSAVGLGCWAIGGDTWRNGKSCGWTGIDNEESIKAIRRALALGANFIDTADLYGCGHSEHLIARAIEGRRDQVIIATKFGFQIDETTRTTTGQKCDRDYVFSACEASLRRLNTEHIDLYQFHLWNSDKGEEVRDVLEELVSSGKIRYYGWSTDNPDNARLFAQGKNCVAIQQRMNVFEGNFETLRVCESHNLASINRGPLAMGLLTGKFSSDTTFPNDDVRYDWDMKEGPQAEQLRKLDMLRDILTSNGRTLAQGAICWLWAISSSTIPIPGFTNVKQVEENLGALEFDPLSSEQLQEIDLILGRRLPPVQNKSDEGNPDERDA
ncbi:MAG: aldo/keto reductase [Candidatus Scalindua sp.]|nr:aldo/keto reductase [Candidatus Scalindua sp.]